VRLVLPLVPAAGQRSEARLELLDGDRLDLLSAYRVGGFAGAYAVAGYFRNEFRARRTAVLHVQHEVAFAAHRKLLLLADGAWLRRVPLAALDGTPETATLLGVGIGLHYGIRALGGLPVIVRYGEGLRVPDGSPESHRRELLLVLAAGF